MKTAEECLDGLVAINLKVNCKHRPLSPREQSNHVTELKELFKQIQLDAFKAGAEWAAKEASFDVIPVNARRWELRAVQKEHNLTIEQVCHKILTAAKQLTEIPKI